MNYFKITVASLVVSLGSLAVASDVRMAPKKPNEKSPEMKTTATIAGKQIRIEYSAPSARGRTVMGQVVPYGQVWRTGADGATTLVTDADLKFGSLSVPKGVYTVWTLPGQNDWQLIINKQTNQWGTNYDASQDLGRVPMKVTKVSSPQEQVKIELKPTGGKTGELQVSWGDVQATAPFTVQ
jgi:hypothetical protein